MRKMLLLIFIQFCAVANQAATGQTVKNYLNKSDNYWQTGRYDSALKYAWLAEPLIADSMTRNSKEYAYFTGQFFSMNHEGAGNMDSAAYWYLFSLNMFEAHNDTASNEYGETLVNYSNMLNDRTYYTEALPYLQKAVAVMQNTGIIQMPTWVV